MDHLLMPALAVAGLAWLLWSLSRYRLTRCPKCNGSGKVYHPLIKSRYKPCPRCSRKGEIRGWFGSED